MTDIPNKPNDHIDNLALDSIQIRRAIRRIDALRRDVHTDFESEIEVVTSAYINRLILHLSPLATLNNSDWGKLQAKMMVETCGNIVGDDISSKDVGAIIKHYADCMCRSPYTEFLNETKCPNGEKVVSDDGNWNKELYFQEKEFLDKKFSDQCLIDGTDAISEIEDVERYLKFDALQQIGEKASFAVYGGKPPKPAPEFALPPLSLLAPEIRGLVEALEPLRSPAAAGKAKPARVVRDYVDAVIEALQPLHALRENDFMELKNGIFSQQLTRLTEQLDTALPEGNPQARRVQKQIDALLPVNDKITAIFTQHMAKHSEKMAAHSKEIDGLSSWQKAGLN